MKCFNNFLNKFTENKLDRSLKILMFIHGLYMCGNAFSSIFINVFIWKVSNNLQKVIEYNIYLSLAVPICFLIGGWISKQKGLRISLILGLFLSTTFYFIVFWFRSNIIDYIGLLGILRGISVGFYFLGFNVLGYDFSSDENRANYFGVLGLVNSVPSMIVPMISGYIISSYMGNVGYGIIFCISFILYLAGTIVSLVIPEKISNSSYNIKQMFVLSTKEVKLGKTMVAEVISASREGVMSFVINILIFIIVQKELTVGNYSFWVFLTATIASYVGGIIIKPEIRQKYLLFGTLAIFLVSGIFLFKLSVLTLYIFGLISAVASMWSTIAHSAITYSVISSIPNSKDLRLELIIIKEIFLGIGKISALLIFAILSTKQELMAYFLFILGAIQILRWVLLRKVTLEHEIRIS